MQSLSMKRVQLIEIALKNLWKPNLTATNKCWKLRQETQILGRSGIHEVGGDVNCPQNRQATNKITYSLMMVVRLDNKESINQRSGGHVDYNFISCTKSSTNHSDELSQSTIFLVVS
mmetsp:Transcript_23799/g.49462  ORF Transcript_23799/g.49462 Transcript_23799/m.49462 type:complete len:117 (+) Transcript_23799:1815-2165(+)